MTAVQLTPEQAKSIGDLLKTTRENQGKNISDVAYQIALSPSQLRAIEAADLKPFYSPGFFYQAAERYAHFLNVSLPKFAPAAKPEPDTEAATTQTPQEEAPVIKAPALPAAEKTVTTTQPPPQQIDTPRRSRWKPIGLAAAVAIVAITLFVDQEPSVNTTPADNTANASSNTTAASEAASTPANTPASAATPAVVASGPTASASANPPAAVATKPAASAPSAPEQNDSRLESATTAWVQIVQKNGEKTNLKIEPGQKIEFTAANTAAIVFGQPDKAKLLVKGKAVDINRFVTADNPSRALVILNQLP